MQRQQPVVLIRADVAGLVRGRHHAHAQVLVRKVLVHRPRSRDHHLVSPGGHRANRRLGDFQVLGHGLQRDSCHQRDAVRVADRDAVFEPVLARPLGDAAGEVHRTAAHLPTLVLELDDRAHRAVRHDAPLAAGHLRHRGHLAVHHGADPGHAQRLADAVDVAAQRALLVVAVLRRPEQLQVQPRTPLAPQVDGVARIPVDAPGGGFRFPPRPFVVRGEPRGGSLGVWRPQPLDSRRVAVGDGHDARRPRLEIDLERQLVVPPVAIQIVGLRRQFHGLERARIFFEGGGLAGGDDGGSRGEIRRHAFERGHRNHDVFRRARGRPGVGHRQLEDFDTRGLSGRADPDT